MPSASIPKRPLAHTLLILALWLMFYGSFTLITPALLDDADSVHAEVAREMLLRHDWVTLYANGIRYLEKAPLLYWAMAACMRLSQLLGHTSAAALTVAARIPLALTILALAFAVEIFARRAFRNTRAGLYAALILLSSFGIFLFTRILIPDALLCLWLTLALHAFYLTEQPDTSQDQISPPPSPQTAIDIEHPGVSRLPDAMRQANIADLPNAARLKVSRGFSLGSHTPKEEKGIHPLGYAVHRPHLLPCLAFAACCALAVLTKGLIGLLFPIAISASYLILARGPRAAVQRIRQLRPLSSLAVFLAIAAPWHILIALANPTQGHPGSLAFMLHPAAGAPHWQVPLPTDGNVHGWAWFYFVNEQLLRYLNLRVPRDYDTVPLWLFLGLILIWLMPWSAFLFQALARAARSSWEQIFPRPAPKQAANEPAPEIGLDFSRDINGKQSSRTSAPGTGLLNDPPTSSTYPSTPQHPAYLLLLLWAAIPLLFFSFSTRQEYYVLPSLPPLVILLAAWLARDSNTETIPRIRRAQLRATATLLAFGTIFAALTLYFLLHTHAPSPNTNLAALLQQNPSDYAMSMGHFLDLNANALALFRLPLALAAAALSLGPLSAYLLGRRNHPHSANLVLAAGAFSFLLATHLALQTFAPVLSSQQLAAAIAPQIQAGDLIVIHQEYEYASTLGFYLQQPTYRFQAVRISPPQTAPPGDNDHADIAIRPIAVNPIHILTDATYNNTPNYGRSSNLWYGSFFPDAPPIFETAQTLAAKWRGPQRIFLWQDLTNQPSPPPAALTPVYVIARSGGKAILSNQPNH